MITRDALAAELDALGLTHYADDIRDGADASAVLSRVERDRNRDSEPSRYTWREAIELLCEACS